MGFASKTMEKKQKDYLRKPKQISVKLQGNKWKTFGLASWKWSKLDVKMKRKTGSSLSILHNTGYDALGISPSRWANPILKSAKELQKLFEVMGLVNVFAKSKINFLLLSLILLYLANMTVWYLMNIVSELAFTQNKQQEEASSGQLARECKQ